MSYSSSSPKKKKRSKAMLPVLGLLFAILLGVVAYFVAPILVDFAREQDADLARQFDQFETDYKDIKIEYITAGLLWLIMMGLGMFFAAALVGQDPEKHALHDMGPSPADKKAMARYLKKQRREAEKRARQRKKQKK